MTTANVKLSADQANDLFYGLMDKGETKEAADLLNDFTRVNIRESSFMEKVLPSQKIGPESLTPQLGTDKPVVLANLEPGSPGAVTVPLGAQPVQFYIRGNRYAVYFDRIVTPKFTKDMTELMTYGIDIRQIVLDNSILDIEFEYDSKLLACVDTIVGTVGSTVTETGIVQNKSINSSGAGITRSTLAELKKILPSSAAKLQTATIVTSVITVEDVSKFDRLAAGGDLSTEFFTEGMTKTRLLGCNWIITNKTELVNSSVFYLFASPEFMGKAFVLEDVTTFVKKEAWRLEFFSYVLKGATIGNVASVAKAVIA